MLILETVVRIRREHADGKSIKAIARDLRLSRKVVRKAIRAPEAGFAYQRTVQPLPRLGPFQERLDALLVENEARPRRERLRMTRVHDLLVREAPSTSSGEPLTVSYDAVRRYAARWLRERRKDVGDGAAAFVPLIFRPGEAYQFDWSHEDGEIAGKPMRGEGRAHAAVRIAGGVCSGLPTGAGQEAGRAEERRAVPGLGAAGGAGPASAQARVRR